MRISVNPPETYKELHLCSNAKYNPTLDSMVCDCCGEKELTRNDFKIGMEVKVKSDRTIGEVATIGYLIGVRWSTAIRYRNQLTYFYPYELTHGK